MEREFDRFGEIKNTKLKQGFAFITYYHKDDARYAIKQMNGKKIFGQQRRIVVEEANGSRRDRERSRERERDRSRERRDRDRERERRRSDIDRERSRDRARYRERRDRDKDRERERSRRDRDRERDREKSKNDRDYEGRGKRKTGPKELDECFNCGKLGHWAFECPNKKDK